MKNKHFEDVWDQAESVSSESFTDEQDAIQFIVKKADLMNTLFKMELLNKLDLNKVVSELLFGLTFISITNDINVWEELENITEQKQINLLEDD